MTVNAAADDGCYDDDDVADDETQGGFRLELLEYDAAGNVNMTYNLTSPADGYVGASNATYVNYKMYRLDGHHDIRPFRHFEDNTAVHLWPFCRASYASTVLAVIVRLSVCPSVHLSQVGVVQRWLNLGSH